VTQFFATGSLEEIFLPDFSWFFLKFFLKKN